jgi:hypothetical protein
MDIVDIRLDICLNFADYALQFARLTLRAKQGRIGLTSCHALKLANLDFFSKFYFSTAFMLLCIIFIMLSALVFESI